MPVHGWEAGVLILSMFILAGMVPLAVLISRDRLRRYRRELLTTLERWISESADVAPLPSFDSARIKYELQPYSESASVEAQRRYIHGDMVQRGSMLSFALPAIIYSGLTALGFLTAFILSADPNFWSAPNFILSGMFKVGEKLTSPELTAYQWNSGALITAGFVGAYLFTLQYLVGRVRDYELSPTSFLIASVSILEGCFIVGIARHVLLNGNTGVATIFAFLLGYFPTFGIYWLIERVRVRTLKQISPAAYSRRFVLPTDMIDGIEMTTKFRLLESGVLDVQNLATANPVLLYVETPYGLLTILDWIAQAQLIVAFGGDTAADLRQIGVRTIFDIEPMGESDATRRLVLEKVWPNSVSKNDDAGTTEALFKVLLSVIAGDVHVRRLRSFWGVMIRLVEKLDPKTQDYQGQRVKAPTAPGGSPNLRTVATASAPELVD
jgi:hypothetical protein